VFTEAIETKSVGEVLSKSIGLAVERSEIIWDPRKDTMVKTVSEEHAKDLEEVLNALREEQSSVTAGHSRFKLQPSSWLKSDMLSKTR